jgi:peroxiredoxin
MTTEQELAAESEQARRELLGRLPPAERETAARQLEALARVATAGIDVGGIAPDFELRNIHGYRVSLSERLRAGPVVLSFFRGAWCSFCNLELRALQRRLPQIEALGATLLAISPETAEHSAKVAERHHLGYDILIDAGNRAAQAYGLISEPHQSLAGFDERFGVDLAEYNAEGDTRLPVPATFVVPAAGRVAAAHQAGDWTQRMEPDAVIEHLRGLQPQ